MARVTIQANQEILKASIEEAEKDGPLSNLSVLWKATEIIYRRKMVEIGGNYDKITPAVIMLRTLDFKIPYKTIAGKKGRQIGSGPILSSDGQRPIHVPRSEKMKEFDTFAKMRISLPVKYHNLVNLAEKGSLKAAIKLKCLDCSCYQPTEIKYCTITGCSLFPHRPFKNSGQNITSNEEEVAKSAQEWDAMTEQPDQENVQLPYDSKTTPNVDNGSPGQNPAGQIEEKEVENVTVQDN